MSDDSKTQCSFPVPTREGTWKGTEFHPISATTFLEQEGDEEEGEWVLEDYLPKGGLVTLAAKPKVGKTTLAYELAVRVAGGELFLNRQTTQGGVLILALEEHPRDVRDRLRELQATCDNLHIHSGRLEPRPSTFEAIAQFVRDKQIILIIVDTLAMFWRLKDENDPAALTQAVKPLLELARETDACVVLIHHFRKSEGAEGDEIRGSTALLASVDVALLLYRHSSENQRRLSATGRYRNTPRELIIELSDGGYTAIGETRDLKLIAEKERLKSSLSGTPEALDGLTEKAGIPPKRAYVLIKELVAEGFAESHGRGVKGDPYKYCVKSVQFLSSPTPSIGTEMEREPMTHDNTLALRPSEAKAERGETLP
jgi:predicted ATP-dependent serine protease